MEIWKDIPNYEALYQASSFGNVRNTKNGKFLKPYIHKSGYCRVTLHKLGKQKVVNIHQLIAITFLNHNPSGHKIVVDHINNIQTDNRLENLQLITQRENASKDKSGSSKYTGVHWHSRDKKWYARIRVGKKRKSLGYYDCEIEASKAYQKALKEL